jgi:ubiquitin carboxyl-terminal hydrolase L3
MTIPVEDVNGVKHFTVLGSPSCQPYKSELRLIKYLAENNPEVMNALAPKLGLSPRLRFHDVCSLTEPSLLAMIPRPCLALLAIIPSTPAWRADRRAEDEPKPDYAGVGPDEPVVWFKQTIGHACGSIGLTHLAINGPARLFIQADSILARIREEALPLKMEERAKYLYDNKDFEVAHQSVAEMGDTIPPDAEGGNNSGHFVAFIKGDDGRLWELEGSRKGPIDRGFLDDDEDVLSEKALSLGIGRIIQLEKASGGGNLRFSCTALAEG